VRRAGSGDIRFIKRSASSQQPTMKPAELVERAIRNSSKTHDTILDAFGASGTMLIACAKSGRQARPTNARVIRGWRFERQLVLGDSDRSYW